MAYSVYRTGTVTLTSGSKAVVGSGTDFVAAKILPGARLTVAGYDLFEVVDSVTDATHLTLVDEATASVSGAGFRLEELVYEDSIVNQLSRLLTAFGTTLDITALDRILRLFPNSGGGAWVNWGADDNVSRFRVGSTAADRGTLLWQYFNGTSWQTLLQLTSAGSLSGVAAINALVGPAGNPGGDKLKFATSTTAGDPGAGYLRLNAAPASATVVYLSETDASGASIAAKLATLDDSTTTAHRGVLRLMKATDQTIWHDYDVTGALTDSGVYDSVPISHIAGNGSFAADDLLYLTFSRTGDKGATGATGATGSLMTDGDYGDIVVSGGAVAIDAGVVDNTKLATMATARIKGRTSAGAGAPEDLTASQVLTLIGAVAKAADTALTAGYTTTAVDDETKSSGTYTPSPNGGNMRRIVNGGAFTLAAPTTGGDYTMVIEVTNNGSAGAITPSGFTRAVGDSLTTTNGHKFLLFITKLNDVAVLQRVALQ